MARLRAPGGCPWDREQTFDTIKRYTLEETYEVLEAIDNRDWKELTGELGDLLLQVLFYAEMAEEQGSFTIDDVLDTLSSSYNIGQHLRRATRHDLPAPRRRSSVRPAHPGAGAGGLHARPLGVLQASGCAAGGRGGRCCSHRRERRPSKPTDLILRRREAPSRRMETKMVLVPTLRDAVKRGGYPARREPLLRVRSWFNLSGQCSRQKK